MKKKLIRLFIETPIWNDDRETSTPADYVWTLEDRIEKEKDLKHYKFHNKIEKDNYSYSIYSNEDTIIIAAHLKDKNEPLIGELVFDRSSKYPFPNVVSAHILKEFRGIGIATDVYEIALKRFGGIVSDTSLSGFNGKGSFNIWAKLSKDYIPYIASRQNKRTKLFRVKKFKREEVMGDPNTRLVISLKPLD